MTKNEQLMKLNGINAIRKPDSAEEINIKVEALMEYLGVQGHWNGKVFKVDKTVPEIGDYTKPIKWKPGEPVIAGKWYYTDDKDLPHEAIAAGVPLNFNDAKFFAFIA